LKNQYKLRFDAAKCIKCKACEVACKQWKGILAGSVKLIWIDEVTQGVFPDVKRTFTLHACLHCAKPACVAACPAGALSKRADGTVIVEGEKCSGCKACLEACQFGIPQFDIDGVMQKCDMCLDRIENGQEPICAATCPTQALLFSDRA
jgi:anaerobic dimethyl sulfoxide reductase subunit B